MHGWRAPIVTLLLALPAALAGCIVPPGAVTAEDGGPMVFGETECAYNASGGADVALSCALPVSVAPARFEVVRIVDACDTCGTVDIGVGRGGVWWIATEFGLLVPREDGKARAIPAGLPPGAKLIAPPTVASAASGGAWWSALVMIGPVPALVIARWDAGGDWSYKRILTPVEVPALAGAERVWSLETDREFVLVLASDLAVWATRSFDGGETFYPAELLSTRDRPTRAGVPHRDSRDRVHVPLLTEGGPLLPASSVAAEQMLTYLTLETSGFWTRHGGYALSAAPAPGTLIRMDDGARMLGFSFTDASGTARRLEAWDDGSMWDPLQAWSREDARVASGTAAGRAGAEVTLSWWESSGDEARLMISRGSGHTPSSQSIVAHAAHAPDEASLAVDGYGRAYAAWALDGEVWLVRELRHVPPPCGPDAHCAAPAARQR